MTQQTGEWVAYTGSYAQISELSDATDGVCLMFEHGKESFVYAKKDISTVDGVVTLSNTVTHYFICNPHPLADMICQWARTGQPVWVREHIEDMDECRTIVYRVRITVTTTPDWNIPNAEYSFTAFEE